MKKEMALHPSYVSVVRKALGIDGIDNVDDRIWRAVWLSQRGVADFVAAQEG